MLSSHSLSVMVMVLPMPDVYTFAVILQMKKKQSKITEVVMVRTVYIIDHCDKSIWLTLE
jgi:hypothetical protein